MYRSFYFLLLILFIPVYLSASTNPQAQTVLNNADHAFFIENKGQWPEEVLYLARMGGMNAWITKTGVVYDFYKLEKRNKTDQEGKTRDKFDEPAIRCYGHVVKTILNENLIQPEVEPKQRQATYYNYFIGNDPSKWARYVPLYKEVEVRQIYNGIDVRYYFDNGLLRYDYIVHPGADPGQISIKFQGIDEYKVNEQGELVLKTNIGIVKQQKPLTYIKNSSHQIESHFVKNIDGSIGIHVANYDNSKKLIIDPLIYSTFIGGTRLDQSNDIAIDKFKNVIITGYTYSADFPIFTGAYNEIFNGGFDIFVSKLKSDGSDLLYSTFIGGSNYDYSSAIALDSLGYSIITGRTLSDDFPIFGSAFDGTYNGNYDAYICKLSPDGTELIYSSYIGGSENDYSNAIAIDDEMNLYISGYTSSDDFPTTPGAFNQIHNGGYYDSFVCKLNPDGSSLIYSTFIGGTSYDYCSSLSLDREYNAYVAGITYSNDFPTTEGAFDQILNGYTDWFVCKLNSSGSELIYSTFIGGSGIDSSFTCSLVIDKDNNAYLSSYTRSRDFPTTSGAYDTSYNGGKSDIFICKLNQSGTDLVYSTFIGGSSADSVLSNSIAVDDFYNVYISGSTKSSDFPISSNSDDISWNGSWDAIFLKLNSDGSNLTYSTFIGGSSTDHGLALEIDTESNAYITGYTYSSDFPIVSGSYDENYNGSGDAFVLKLSQSNPSIELISPIGNEIWQANTTHNIFWLEDNSPPSDSVLIDFSMDGGQSWIKLKTVATGIGSLSWIVPPMDNDSCRIRVSYACFPEYSSQSADNFTITTSTANGVFVKHPNGGDTIQVGSEQQISWRTTGTVNLIDIELTTDNGHNWQTIATNIPAEDSSYTWLVGQQNPPADKCRIRLKDSSNELVNDISDNTFRIVKLEVVEPKEGESIQAGTQKTIKWNSMGIDSIKLEYSVNNGQSWTIITDKYPAADSTYNWTVPSASSDSCLIKISDSENSTIYDISGLFSIYLPSAFIRVTSPETGDIFKAQTTQIISWESVLVDSVKIEYSTNNGGMWTIINPSYPASDSTYSWTIPSVSSDSCLVRVSDFKNDSIYGLSGLFEIWKPITQSITPSEPGQDTIIFDLTFNTLYMFILYPDEITTTYYEHEMPDSGDLPADVVGVKDQFWDITSDISFYDGYISVPLSIIRDINDPTSITWLKRSNSGDPWEDIGGMILNDSLISTISLSTFNSGHAEFAIGLKENPSAMEETRTIPQEFTLKQNYPNPFNPVTTIEYALPEASEVQLIIYNLLGQKVVELVNSKQTAGYYKYPFNALDYSSGIYFYVLQARGLQSNRPFKQMKKMVVLK